MAAKCAPLLTISIPRHESIFNGMRSWNLHISYINGPFLGVSTAYRWFPNKMCLCHDCDLGLHDAQLTTAVQCNRASFITPPSSQIYLSNAVAKISNCETNKGVVRFVTDEKKRAMYTVQCTIGNKPWLVESGILNYTYIGRVNLRGDANRTKHTAKVYIGNNLLVRNSMEVTETPFVDSSVNTLRPRQNVRHFADDISKCISLNETVWI